MSTSVQCPLCEHSSKHNAHPNPQWASLIEETDLDISPIKEVHLCPCRRTIWIEGYGWLVSVEFIKNLKEQLHQSNPESHNSFFAQLSSIIPQEMKIIPLALDKSVVKLYCSNDKCTEEGFITRTKSFAEKHSHFCSLCNGVLTW